MTSLYKKILFSSISIIFVLASVEAGLRVLYYVRSGRPSHVLSRERAESIRKILPYDENGSGAIEKGDFLIKNGYYTYNPKVGFVQGGAVRINNLGFRGEDVHTEPRAIRIWCLGGSTTFGYGSKRSFPELLQEDLNKNGNRYIVINGGIPGMNAQHIYNMLRDRSFIDKIKPDIIILNTYWNAIEQYENGLLIETAENEALKFILRNSTLAFLVYKSLIFIKYNELVGPFQALCIYVDRIRSLAEKNNFKVILVSEPLVLDYKAWKAAPEHPKNHTLASVVFKRFQDKDEGVVLFIPLRFFETFDYGDKAEVERFFVDKGHMTIEGNKKMAEDLSEAIQQLALNEGAQGA